MKTKVIITSNDLSLETKEEMWRIYHNHYNYTKTAFMARIEKNNYFAFYSHRRTMVGFTGLRIDRTELNAQKTLLIYFGQTFLMQGFRGKGLMQITAAKIVLKFLREMLFQKVYFWADALTYKAYLAFVKKVETCYPSRKYTIPVEVKDIFHFIGHKYYGETYCEKTGTVKKATKLVQDHATEIEEQDLQDPDIQFYVKANPNYVQGHGLLTLCPFTLRELFTVTKSYFSKNKPSWQFRFPVYRKRQKQRARTSGRSFGRLMNL